MDVTTINAIANKLGIAVQSAEEFVNYILPQMVSYNITQCILTIIFAVVANAVFISLFVIGWKKESDILVAIFGTLSVFSIIFGVIALVIGIPEIIGWANWPEVMLFNKILGAC